MKSIPSLWYLSLALLLFAWACDGPLGTRNDSGNGPSTVITAKGGGGGGGEEIAGNNLSFPVIWADGVSKALRGSYLTEVFEGTSFTKNDTIWYEQADLLNTWQAESYDPTTVSMDPVTVSTIDWGDNLEAKSWAFGAQIRVETVLYKTLTERPMTAYRMMMKDETVSGLEEVWGTSGLKYPSREATVYSGTARLVIQKLTKTREDTSLTLSWNPVSSQWTGDAKNPVVSSGVWTMISGPTAYSAEINVQGKLIYGYNWVTKRDADDAGDYRITFVLEPSAPGVVCNTLFDENTSIRLSEEETELMLEAEPVTTGGVARVSTEHNLTYIDVRLTTSNGGGKQGGGNQGGGKSGSGGGRHR
jgi:hypothetical protein